jgi:hypothetical protein
MQPILERSITIEFYLAGDKNLYLIYNKKKYSFNEFWNRISDAENICMYILEQFKYQFPEKYRKAEMHSDDWKETFIKVINNHMRIKDKKLDVFIRNSGDVIFNLEL